MAKWVEFTRDFDFAPTKRAIIAFKKGMHLNVTEAAAEAAIAAGAAVETGHVSKAGDAQDGTQEIRTNGKPTEAKLKG